MKTTKIAIATGLFLGLVLSGLTGSARAETPQETALIDAQIKQAPQLARYLVKYSQMKLGKRVGDGQCTALVVAALKTYKCRPGDFSDKKNYKWGKQKPAGAPIATGDIIQFEDCKFVTTTKTSSGGTNTRTHTMTHHTAIVRAAIGNKVFLIDQNEDGVGPVKTSSLNLNDIKSGTYTVWVAVPQ